MFSADFTKEDVAAAITGHVKCWNSKLLTAVGEPIENTPAWHPPPNGEVYLSTDLAPNAAKRLFALCKKKRWSDFRRCLAQLAIHIRGKVIRKDGAATAAHVVDSLLDDFSWRSKGDREAFRRQSIDIIRSKDSARDERLAELIAEKYTPPA